MVHAVDATTDLPEQREALVTAALQASKSKDWDVAIKRWGEILTAYEDAPAEAYQHQAAAFRQLRQLDLAQGVIARGQAKYPDHLGIKAEAAEMAMVTLDWKSAIELWHDIRRVSKKASRTYDRAVLGLHLSYAALGDFEQSLACYTKLKQDPAMPIPNFADRDARRIFNLLTYTKTSGARYAARRPPAGYQTIKIGEEVFRGSRDPAARFDVVPIDFTGKSVLDIGSNQGGMLFHLAKKISSGVGLDYDTKMVNAANSIARAEKYNHLTFFNFDLDKEAVDIIPNFIPSARVDVVLLFRVLGWLSKPEETLRIIAGISDTLVFQNHVNRSLNLRMLSKYFSNIQQCTDHSADPNIRDIYVCSNARGA